MAGIAGIARQGAEKEVAEMLEKMNHRGRAKSALFQAEGTTMGMIWNEVENNIVLKYLDVESVADDQDPGHCASAKAEKGRFLFQRDELGVAPLYTGIDKHGSVCFSSEVKALLPFTDNVTEIPAGHRSDGTSHKAYFELISVNPVSINPDLLAKQLRKNLDEAVKKCIRTEDTGSWLSGGIDSSTISALAARHLKKLKTFAAGLKGAPDLEFATETARFIKSEHHEVIVTMNDLVHSLPEVIYHLESFDALLVRSSIINFLVAKRASDYVADVFSGEGGDELFAGYEYLKTIPVDLLADELIKITKSLHNTAFQRVDRCASAHGIVAHIVFTNPEVVKLAFSIPVKYKINNNIEKWILRRAMEGSLPDQILKRPKEKFWEGAGVKELISEYAGNQISDKDFQHERRLPGGWLINTKEELYYYRIFTDHFGAGIDLSWMGRTSGSPVE